MVDRWILQPGDIAAVYNDPHREFILGYFNPDPMVSLLVFFSIDYYFSFSIHLYRLERNSFGATQSSPKVMITGRHHQH